MTKRKENGVEFDRSYWPAKTEGVFTVEVDINDLLNEHLNYADTFIAESLINNPPFVTVHLKESSCEVNVSMWRIGGDILTYKKDLVEAVVEEVENIGCNVEIDDDKEQLAEAKTQLAYLHRVVQGIENAKDKLQDIIDNREGK